MNPQVRLDGQTVWLTQAQMAELFQTGKQNISLHIQNVLDDKELPGEAVVKEYLTTASDGKNYRTFHYSLDQNWFRDRLHFLGEHVETGGRNSYPDFRMVEHTDGFEVKGLAYPGREASFDSNSQLPTGHNNGRTIYYVFGRYPKQPDGDNYPVLDLAI